MNIAMLDLQASLAVQGVAPTQGQQRNDPANIRPGCARCCAPQGVDDDVWLAAVAQHHEMPDGSGYPGGISDRRRLSQMLRHVDDFVAKISPRAGRTPCRSSRPARAVPGRQGGGRGGGDRQGSRHLSAG
jgi:hypothetical protein